VNYDCDGFLPIFVVNTIEFVILHYLCMLGFVGFRKGSSRQLNLFEW